MNWLNTTVNIFADKFLYSYISNTDILRSKLYNIAYSNWIADKQIIVQSRWALASKTKFVLIASQRHRNKLKEDCKLLNIKLMNSTLKLEKGFHYTVKPLLTSSLLNGYPLSISRTFTVTSAVQMTYWRDQTNYEKMTIWL